MTIMDYKELSTWERMGLTLGVPQENKEVVIKVYDELLDYIADMDLEVFADKTQIENWWNSHYPTTEIEWVLLDNRINHDNWEEVMGECLYDDYLASTILYQAASKIAVRYGIENFTLANLATVFENTVFPKYKQTANKFVSVDKLIDEASEIIVLGFANFKQNN